MIDKDKLIKDAYRFCNERARLQHALELTLEGIGVDVYRVNLIVKHAKEHADFVPLESAILNRMKLLGKG